MTTSYFCSHFDFLLLDKVAAVRCRVVRVEQRGQLVVVVVTKKGQKQTLVSCFFLVGKRLESEYSDIGKRWQADKQAGSYARVNFDR